MTPYTSPEGFHRHQCRNCGAVWEHEDRDYDLESAEVRRELAADTAHDCPVCGFSSHKFYHGPQRPIRTTITTGDEYVLGEDV